MSGQDRAQQTTYDRVGDEGVVRMIFNFRCEISVAAARAAWGDEVTNRLLKKRDSMIRSEFDRRYVELSNMMAVMQRIGDDEA